MLLVSTVRMKVGCQGRSCLELDPCRMSWFLDDRRISRSTINFVVLRALCLKSPLIIYLSCAHPCTKVSFAGVKCFWGPSEGIWHCNFFHRVPLRILIRWKRQSLACTKLPGFADTDVCFLKRWIKFVVLSKIKRPVIVPL